MSTLLVPWSQKVGNGGEGSKRRSLNAKIDLKHEIIKIVENGSGNGLHFANHHEANEFSSMTKNPRKIKAWQKHDRTVINGSYAAKAAGHNPELLIRQISNYLNATILNKTSWDATSKYRITEFNHLFRLTLPHLPHPMLLSGGPRQVPYLEITLSTLIWGKGRGDNALFCGYL